MSLTVEFCGIALNENDAARFDDIVQLAALNRLLGKKVWLGFSLDGPVFTKLLPLYSHLTPVIYRVYHNLRSVHVLPHNFSYSTVTHEDGSSVEKKDVRVCEKHDLNKKNTYECCWEMMRKFAHKNGFASPEEVAKSCKEKLRNGLTNYTALIPPIINIVVSYLFGDRLVPLSIDLRDVIIDNFSLINALDIGYLMWQQPRQIALYMNRFFPEESVNSSSIHDKPMKYLYCVVKYCQVAENPVKRQYLSEIVGIYSDRERAVFAMNDAHLVNKTTAFKTRIFQVIAEGGFLKLGHCCRPPPGIKNKTLSVSYEPPSFSHTRKAYCVAVFGGYQIYIEKKIANSPNEKIVTGFINQYFCNWVELV